MLLRANIHPCYHLNSEKISALSRYSHTDSRITAGSTAGAY